MTFPEELRYWKRQLDGLSVLELPVGRSLPHGMESTTTAHAFRVPRDVATRLAALVIQEGVSLLDLTVAAFDVVLARYTGQDDVAVTTPAPGSGHLVVLRSRADETTSFLKFLAEVRATASS